jgi:sigma-B regulation protein RsbU (phosphoserine phosphatase)
MSRSPSSSSGPAAVVEAPVPALLVRHPDARETLVPLSFESAVIGRGAEAEIRLDHPMVSRKHAQLTREADGRFVLADLGSRNGTVVNGRAVQTRVLEPGDQITLGPFHLEIQIPSFAGEGLTTRHTRVHVSDAAAGRIDTLNDVEQPRVHATHLMTLNEFAQRLLATESAGDRCKALCELLTGENFHGRWAAMLRIDADEEDDAPLLLCECHCDSPRPHTHAAHAHREQPYLSRSVLRAVRTKGQAVVASNVAPQIDLQVSIAPSVMSLAAVASPLSRTARHIDLLYVVLPPEYGTGEWLAMAVMAGKQYTSAENAWAARRQAEAHAAVERDLSRARDIQFRLVPRDPQVPGLDLAIGFSPCRWVGGDYVDVVPVTSGGTKKVLLAVADVCGKGLPAALTTSSLHTMVHAGVLSASGLCPMMNNLNRYLRNVLPEETFVTMAAVLLDPVSGEVEYVNAGHPPALILEPGQAPRRLEKTENMPLRLDEAEIVGRQMRLEPGQVLVLYSDGLTEIELREGSAKLLGIDGLARELGEMYESAGTSAKDLAGKLRAKLGEMLAGRDAEDDQTFLLAKRV